MCSPSAVVAKTTAALPMGEHFSCECNFWQMPKCNLTMSFSNFNSNDNVGVCAYVFSQKYSRHSNRFPLAYLLIQLDFIHRLSLSECCRHYLEKHSEKDRYHP